MTEKVNRIKLKIHDYIWLLPFIGGILSLITLIVPATVIDKSYIIFSIKGFIYIWGYAFISGSIVLVGTFEGSFFPEDPIQVIGIVVIICIIITTGIITISASIRARDSKKENNLYEKLWFVLGMSMIILAISWVIGVDLMTRAEISRITSGLIEINIWEIATVSYGLICLFLGGSLCIIGSIISIRLPKISFEKEILTKETSEEHSLLKK